MDWTMKAVRCFVAHFFLTVCSHFSLQSVARISQVGTKSVFAQSGNSREVIPIPFNQTQTTAPPQTRYVLFTRPIWTHVYSMEMQRYCQKRQLSSQYLFIFSENSCRVKLCNVMKLWSILVLSQVLCFKLETLQHFCLVKMSLMALVFSVLVVV